MMNSKFYSTLPLTIKYLKKWKFFIWCCPMFSESNRTVSNSSKIKILITIKFLLLEIGGTPINYAWLNSPDIGVFSG